MEFLNIFLKLLIGYTAIVVYFHIVGRSAMAPATASDQVQNFFLGGMAGAVILNFSISPMYFLIILFIWFSIIAVINRLKLKFSFVRSLVEGNSIELYADNKPNKQGFLKAKLSAGDFITLLRNQGITSIEDLNNVRIEANGQLSISEKTENSFNKYLIVDGQINHTELNELNKKEPWLLSLAASENIDLKDIFIMEYNTGNERVVIIKKPE
ncbi:DUF421 domain-containing protein [Enterococcus faecalis]